MVMCIQQLCILKISKNGKSVGYLDTKDQAKEGSIRLYIQDTMNLNLVAYLKANFTMLWRFLMIAKFLMV